MKERFIMRKFDSKRKGFTLVELLIVIVVIGILSAMMMLSSSEAVSSARATTIVADLRNIKTAALAYYTDHIDDFAANPALCPTMTDIKPYLTSGKTADNNGLDGYILVYENSALFIKYTIAGTNTNKIQEKLEGRAKSVGLLGATTKSSDNTYVTTYTKDKAVVYMLVR